LCMYFLLFNALYSKNIYVVYDDSLSMKKENRDVYANYAIQTLSSLLSEEDNLTITRMSDTKDNFRNKTVVNLKDIKNELKYFEKNLKAKSQVTPYRSIETIVDYIEKTSSKDEQNWLMVITDGEFEDGKPIPNIESIKNSISKSVQNSNLKPVFLLIGSNQNELEKYEKQKGIQIWKEIFGEGEFPKIFKASNEKEIIVKMREIAQLLTSKSSKSLKDIYVIKNNRLEFNSLFPLSKIIFLDQIEGKDELNSLEKIYVDGKEIQIDKQYKPHKNEGEILLSANVIHIDGNNSATRSIVKSYSILKVA
ncbi:MAG: VWA domain-containing protein, partial [Fusobacteriaceae bacterium]